MSELTKIASILCKHLSDALLSAASELSRDTSEKNPIIVSSKPNIASLAIGNHVTFELRSGKRYGGKVVKIDGGLVDIENEAISKSWTISTSQVIDFCTGDFYYNK